MISHLSFLSSPYSSPPPWPQQVRVMCAAPLKLTKSWITRKTWTPTGRWMSRLQRCPRVGLLPWAALRPVVQIAAKARTSFVQSLWRWCGVEWSPAKLWGSCWTRKRPILMNKSWLTSLMPSSLTLEWSRRSTRWRANWWEISFSFSAEAWDFSSFHRNKSYKQCVVEGNTIVLWFKITSNMSITWFYHGYHC